MSSSHGVMVQCARTGIEQQRAAPTPKQGFATGAA